MKTKIYYHHTDCGGVVYYANYLKFFEEARTEYFKDKGFSIKELADSGTMFVVSRQEIDYKYPSAYADILDIKTSIPEMSGVRIIFEHEILNQNSKVIVKGRTTLVCVDSKLKPKAIPEEIRKKLTL